jgi:predicted DNA-binding protein
MSPKKLVAFRFDLELIEGLAQVKERTGAPIAEQVRRAIQTWLASQGIKPKSDRRGSRKPRRS